MAQSSRRSMAMPRLLQEDATMNCPKCGRRMHEFTCPPVELKSYHMCLWCGHEEKEWTAKDEKNLQFLVDEIFKECGPQAVADTRKACEMSEKSCATCRWNECCETQFESEGIIGCQEWEKPRSEGEKR